MIMPCLLCLFLLACTTISKPDKSQTFIVSFAVREHNILRNNAEILNKVYSIWAKSPRKFICIKHLYSNNKDDQKPLGSISNESRRIHSVVSYLVDRGVLENQIRYSSIVNREPHPDLKVSIVGIRLCDVDTGCTDEGCAPAK